VAILFSARLELTLWFRRRPPQPSSITPVPPPTPRRPESSSRCLLAVVHAPLACDPVPLLSLPDPVKFEIC
jgi:hypothetical protein